MINILDVEVSLFNGYINPEDAKTINLYNWLLDSSMYQEVLKIREIRSKKERDSRKATLPAITPSGVFHRRSNNALKQHSGLICLDIDEKDNLQFKDMNALKRELSNLDNVAYCGLSVSGRGLFLLIPITNPEKHKQHFDALKSVFASKYNITIDNACSDVARLRVYSYDPEAYLNIYATPFSRLVKPPQPKPIAYYATDNGDKVQQLVAEICRQGINIGASYEEYRNIGFAFANEFGEMGRAMYHALCSPSEKYSQQQCDKDYTYFVNRHIGGGAKITIATFFKYCKDWGMVVSNRE